MAAITTINPRSINTTGDYVVHSIDASANVTAGNVKTNHLLYANGVAWTFGSTYTDSNVASYLLTNTGNIAAGNVSVTGTLSTGTITTTGSSGNISGANYITANYFVGNGSQLTSINAVTLNNKSDTAFATSAQGTKADTALQSGANISLLTNDSGFLTNANLTGYATESFVTSTVANVIDLAPSTLDTLKELANAIGNDASFSTTITTGLSNKLDTSAFNSTANTWLTLQTTSNVAEGTNLYYTVSRANTAIDNRVTKTFIDGLGVIAAVANSVTGANVTGQVSNALIAGTVYTNAQPNITSVGTLASLSVTGLTTATGGIKTANIFDTSGTVTLQTKYNSQPGDVGVVGNIIAGTGGAGNVSATYFVGNGAFLTGIVAGTTYANTNVAAYLPTYAGNVSAGNLLTDHLLYANGSPYVFTGGATVSATAPSSPIAGDLWLDSNTGDISVYFGGAWAALTTQSATAQTVTSNAQPNITSVGTLSSLNVSGNVTASYLIGNGSQLTGLPASYANANVAAYLPTYTGNFTSGNVSVTGTLSTGTITTTGASGNISGANYITANYFVGNGSNVSNVDALTLGGHSASYFATSTQGAKADTALQSGANISLLTNDTGFITTANLSTYATQTFVNSAVANLINSAPGALDTLSELANALGNDASYSTTITNALANKLSTSAFTSTADTWLATKSTSNVAEGTNLYYTIARANTAIDTRVTKTFVDGLGVVAAVANSVAGANVTGQVSNALISGTVYTAAQPNITSVGTLISLSINGNVTAGNIAGGNLVSANYVSGNGSLLTAITGANVTGYVPNANVANIAYSVSGANVSGNVSQSVHAYFSDTANSVAGANVTGQVSNALISGTVYTNAQPNITSVGSLSSLTVTGTLSLNDITKLYIPGGTNNYVLKTDGSGNLSWTQQLISGNAVISGSNTQVFFNNGSNTLGASANLIFNTASNTLTTTNLTVSKNTNLGAVGNITITGGSTNNYLKTDGAGTLSWAQLPTTSLTVDSYTGNGVQTQYTLSSTPTSVNYTIVAVAGVLQPKSTYSVSTNVLTFSEAPPNNAPVEVTTINSGVSAPTGGGSSGYTYQGISANTTLAVATKYIVNTSASALTLTLPSSATLGDEISIIDGTGTASTHNITVYANGGNIMGNSGNLVVSTNRAAFTLVYYNAAQGWLLTQV